MPHDFDLQRFVVAQDSDGDYQHAVRELRAGRKASHWMWFVFPQVAGLGHSPTAQYYAISGSEEAEAYLAHPMLGPRLIECAGIVAGLDESDPVAVFGHIDAIKLRSSMTLFAAVAPHQSVFRAVIEKCFGGELDAATTSRV